MPDLLIINYLIRIAYTTHSYTRMDIQRNPLHMFSFQYNPNIFSRKQEIKKSELPRAYTLLNKTGRWLFTCFKVYFFPSSSTSILCSFSHHFALCVYIQSIHAHSYNVPSRFDYKIGVYSLDSLDAVVQCSCKQLLKMQRNRASCV